LHPAGKHPIFRESQEQRQKNNKQTNNKLPIMSQRNIQGNTISFALLLALIKPLLPKDILVKKSVQKIMKVSFTNTCTKEFSI
jgi:hypothetical protein